MTSTPAPIINSGSGPIALVDITATGATRIHSRQNVLIIAGRPRLVIPPTFRKMELPSIGRMFQVPRATRSRFSKPMVPGIIFLKTLATIITSG